jgi:hypothetical protein
MPAADKLLGAIAQAERRDDLEHQLSHAQSTLASLPPVGVIDPQAESAARLIEFVTGKTISPDSVANARMLAMIVWPQMSGLALLFAMAVWRK